MILHGDSIHELRSVIRRWVAQLAEGRLDEAASEMTSQDSPWSSEALREAIGNYRRAYRDASGTDRERFYPRLTSPEALTVAGENLVLYAKFDHVLIEYDLPIDRDWSDLTARFRLAARGDGVYELSLVDLHAL